MAYDPAKLQALKEAESTGFDPAKLKATKDAASSGTPDLGLDTDAIRKQQLDNPEQPFTWDNGGRQLLGAGVVTAGQLGGTLAGTLGGPAAWITVPAGEIAGGMGAEYLNQKLGLTDPSTPAILAQGIVPGVVRGVTSTSKILPPSTRGAEFLNTIAPREATAQLNKLGIVPGQASAKMNAVKLEDNHIPTPDTRTVITKSLDMLNGGAGYKQYAGTTEHLRNLDDRLYKEGSHLRPEQFQKELRDLRPAINAAKSDVEKKALLDVKDSLEQALLHNPTGQRLAGARHDILRESVVNDLHELTFQNSKNMAGQGDQIQFNARPILDKLEGKGGKANQAFQARFEAAFEPQDQANIIKVYRKLNQFDKLAPPAGVNAGSMKVLRPLVTGTGLGGVAHYWGASPELAAGIAGAAMLVPGAINAARVMKLAMTTQEGRAELARIVSDPKVKTWGDLIPRMTNFLAATSTPQQAIRDLTSTTIEPFPNER